jgi:hypothetical protein
LSRAFSVTTNSSKKGLANVLEVSGESTVMREGSNGEEYTYFSPANIFLGLNAGTYTTPSVSDGYMNVFLGNYSGLNNVSGRNNIFMGEYSGANNVGGTYDNYFGEQVVTGNNNIYIGTYAGRTNDIGYQNVMIGSYSNMTGKARRSTFVGRYTGWASEGYDNVFVGADAAKNNKYGDKNVIIGQRAGLNIGLSTAAYNNTFIGDAAGLNNSSGSANVFIGKDAGYNETGSNKLYISNSNTSTPLIKGTFPNSDLDLTASSIRLNGTSFANNNFHIGTATAGTNRLRVESAGTGINGSTGYFYNTGTGGIALSAIANTTDVVLYVNQSNTTSATTNIVKFASDYGGWSEKVYIQNSGKVFAPYLGTGTGSDLYITSGGEMVKYSSSSKYKNEISDLSVNISKFMKLRPVSFRWNEKSSSNGIKDYGLIAEDVEKIDTELAKYDGKGNVEGVDYQKINIMLLKVVQEQEVKLSRLEDELNSIKKILKIE